MQIFQIRDYQIIFPDDYKKRNVPPLPASYSMRKQMITEVQAVDELQTNPLNRAALEEAFERYNDPLFRYAYRLLGDADQAEECVAETFSRLLHTVTNGGKVDNLRAYLYRVAHNWAVDTYRRREPVQPLHVDLPGDPESSPSAVAARNSEQEQVREALSHLTSEQRQVVVLRFIENWSHEEIATVVGKTVEATRALQHRALLALRELLGESKGNES
jgi:RNA polymerase sigma-70 factor, ECF subfamily